MTAFALGFFVGGRLRAMGIIDNLINNKDKTPMPTRSPQSHRLRSGRFSEQGRPYLVTAVCHNRAPIFNSLIAARCFSQAIGDIQHQALTWCFVIMPDHIHWLMQPEHDLSLSKCVQRVKAFTTRKLHRLGLCDGVVWQDGFHDHALRKDEDIKAMARYVIANPIRAGLVKQIGDYPHWDAAWL